MPVKTRATTRMKGGASIMDGSFDTPASARSGRINANGIDDDDEIPRGGGAAVPLHGGLGSIDLFGPNPVCSPRAVR